MTPKDRKALTSALGMAPTLAPEIARAVDAMLATSDWRDAGLYAAYHCQLRSLRLRVWQCPPCDAYDEVTDRYGGMPAEVALRRRLISLKLSVYEPDVLVAIEAAERARAERTEPEAPADPLPVT